MSLTTPPKRNAPKTSEPTVSDTGGGQLTVRLDDDRFKRFSMLKASTGKTKKALVEEALDLLEKKYGAT